MITLEEVLENNSVYQEYSNLDLPEDTKQLLKRAISEKREGVKEYLPNSTTVYTVYHVRTNKGKGEDLFNDITEIFEMFNKRLEHLALCNERYAYVLQSDCKKELNAGIGHFKDVRKNKSSKYASVRTITSKEIPEGSIDYNSMIFTVLKTRLDALLSLMEWDTAAYRDFREYVCKHLLTESATISNCVDIPILAYIEESQEEVYVEYLGEVIGTTIKLAEAASSCCRIVEDLDRYYENNKHRENPQYRK